MKRSEIITAIMEALTVESIKIEILEELDSYCGYLGDDARYSMDMFDELFYGLNPIEIASKVAYGSDDEGSSFFRTDREYFYYDGYGNLVSTNDYIDVDYYDNGEIIDKIEEIGCGSLWFSNRELEELFEQLEEVEEA